MTSEEFKAVRLSLGFTQEELARRLGCSYNSIFKNEKAYRGQEITSVMATALKLLEENVRLRNEVMAYRTGDKEFTRKSSKMKRLQDLHRQEALIKDAIRREGTSIVK